MQVCPPEGQESFKQQYPDAFEEIGSSHPKPLGVRSVWFDANHAHQVTTRSISGIIVYVHNTPILWKSARQGAIYPSTYGAELCAGRLATEETEGKRLLLRSLGEPVNGPTIQYGDNVGMLQAT